MACFLLLLFPSPSNADPPSHYRSTCPNYHHPPSMLSLLNEANLGVRSYYVHAVKPEDKF